MWGRLKEIQEFGNKNGNESLKVNDFSFWQGLNTIKSENRQGSSRTSKQKLETKRI